MGLPEPRRAAALTSENAIILAAVQNGSRAARRWDFWTSLPGASYANFLAAVFVTFSAVAQLIDILDLGAQRCAVTGGDSTIRRCCSYGRV
jgi:hypothetical protein